MIALAVLILMVVAVVVLSWHWRDKPNVTCCNGGPWPPDDISARPARPTARPALTAPSPAGVSRGPAHEHRTS